MTINIETVAAFAITALIVFGGLLTTIVYLVIQYAALAKQVGALIPPTVLPQIADILRSLPDLAQRGAALTPTKLDDQIVNLAAKPVTDIANQLTILDRVIHPSSSVTITAGANDSPPENKRDSSE